MACFPVVNVLFLQVPIQVCHIYTMYVCWFVFVFDFFFVGAFKLEEKLII